MGTRSGRRHGTGLALAAGAVLAVTVLAACSGSGSGSSGSTAAGSADGGSATSAPGGSSGPTGSGSVNNEHLNIAYLDYSVANPYDTPIEKQAKKVAAANNASITVFDGNNSPQTQYSQLQDIVASGKYQAVLVQAISGGQLVPAVQQALQAGLKVAAVDQPLGPDPTTAKIQVPGLTTSVTLVPQATIAEDLSDLIIKACASKNLDPCNVGYIWGVKASTVEQSTHKLVLAKLASHPEIKIIAEGECEYQQSVGLKSAQNMLTAHPNINLFYAPEQGLEGAMQAAEAAGKAPGTDIMFVGGGGGSHSLANVKSGKWFGLMWSAPGTTAKLATQQLIEGIRQNKTFPGTSVVSVLPNHAEVTRENADQFHSEYVG